MLTLCKRITHFPVELVSKIKVLFYFFDDTNLLRVPFSMEEKPYQRDLSVFRQMDHALKKR